MEVVYHQQRKNVSFLSMLIFAEMPSFYELRQKDSLCIYLCMQACTYRATVYACAIYYIIMHG